MTLTWDHRDWLRAQDGQMLLKDFILAFIARFDLTPGEAGILMGQWVRELAAPVKVAA